MDGMPWWRRPSVLGAIAGAIVLLAVAAIALGSDDSEPSSLAVRAGTTTSTASSDTTTTSVAETTTTTAGSGTTTTTGRRTATTTATTRVPATAPPTTASRTALTEPPTATMRSGDGEVAGERGTYCWQRDGQGLCSDSSDIDPKQTLRVRQGSSVDIRWAIEEQPSQVQGKYTEGTQWVDFNPPLPATNPAQFAANFSPGVHTVAVFSVWSKGDVVHYFKIDVYQ